jgi:secreted PhoX family phosphatase
MPLPGGTTTLIYDLKSGRKEAEWLSLSGTIRNCAGGITPWGSWLTCEENVTRAGQWRGQGPWLCL